MSTLRIVAHPLRRSHSHDLLEGDTECIIITETTLKGQFLGGYRLMGSCCLMVFVDKMLNAQPVDVGIVGCALTGEILAEIQAVGSNLLNKLGKGEVVFLVELLFLAILLQHRLDIIANG